MIFHLSYNFGEDSHESINFHIPDEICKVKYRDLDYAVRNCLHIIREAENANCIEPIVLWHGITDLQSAFRTVLTNPQCWPLLIMAARHPVTGREYIWIDKCLPFGASISCVLFQQFSNSLAHIVAYLLGRYAHTRITNYLDDFLFVHTSEQSCNNMVRKFHNMCDYLGVPISREKTVWASTELVFLGITLDGGHRVLSLPAEKCNRARQLLQVFVDRKKATVKEIQKLTGFLNFLGHAIYLGRAFTRRMYAKISNKCGKLKHYHHVSLDKEFRDDCLVWLKFLNEETTLYCRSFIDLDVKVTAEELGLYTDSSANGTLGFGGVMLSQRKWIFGQWPANFVSKYHPSIEYLELFAVVAAVVAWSEWFPNARVFVHCDNLSVVNMINQTSSSCKHCMCLIRRLVLHCLQSNVRVFALHVRGIHNNLSDSLSRLQFNRFWRLA